MCFEISKLHFSQAVFLNSRILKLLVLLMKPLEKIQPTKKEKRISGFEHLQGSAWAHPRTAKSGNKFLISLKHLTESVTHHLLKWFFTIEQRFLWASGEPKHYRNAFWSFLGKNQPNRFVSTAWQDGIFTGNSKNSMDTSRTTAPEIRVCK